MATSSNNAEPKSVSKDTLAENNSFGQKGNSELPFNQIDEDKHIVRDCDSFIGGKS